ncbi:hypothetical protein VSO92_08285 [Myroides pelagicus]|uniref:hypothetical protein n=1 Tax=Myroides pelagicus TaxID=270914 RepID=UPI002DBA9268|nr:hypothetical protein [Myroides pelagicus]MEC4114103.1 hypothetical protein [Myroides pelagicus]
MRNLVKVVVSACLLAVTAGFQSCSADSSNNIIEISSNLEIKNNYIEQKWIAAHFDFTPDCDRNAKTAYQKSIIEIVLKDGQYAAHDKYSMTSSQGTYTLEGSRLTMTSEQGKVHQYKITELGKREARVEVLNDPNLLAVELVSL